MTIPKSVVCSSTTWRATATPPSPRVTVESLRVVREPVARVEMVVVAYFQKPQPAQAAGAKP